MDLIYALVVIIIVIILVVVLFKVLALLFLAPFYVDVNLLSAIVAPNYLTPT